MTTYLLLIGAQKAGTQSLAHYLNAQPRVRFCVRELNFFSDDQVWARGRAWYDEQFGPTDADVSVVGETSPSYTMGRAYPETAARIAATLPDARLVYLVRDPVERLRSAYQHGLASGAERRPMRQALLADELYLDTSRYAAQLDRYLAHFDRDQILVIESDDLRTQRERAVERVVRFAGLGDPVVTPPDREMNVTADRRVPRRWAATVGGVVMRRQWDDRVPRRLVRWRENDSPILTRAFRAEETVMPDDLRQTLRRLLRPDVSALRQWLGDDFHGWGMLDD